MALEGFDWKPDYLTVFHLVPAKEDAPEEGTQARVLVRCEGFPEAEESFHDFMDAQLRQLFEKKCDTAASAACKVYDFLSNEKGEQDRSLLEDQLLMATDPRRFQQAADELLERILLLDGIKPGLILVQRLSANFGEGEKGGHFLAILWVDFQDASAFRESPELRLEEVFQIVLKRLDRGLLYPFVQESELRHDLVKMLCRPAKHAFSELFALKPPPTTERLLQDEVARAIFSRGPEAKQKYRAYFEKLPPKKRELFGTERMVKVDDLLPVQDAAAVSRESSRTSKDLYAKDQKMKITIDGSLTVDVQLEELGRSFFFAEEGEEKYLVIKGKRFVTGSARLSSVDFLKTEPLEDVLKKARG